MQVAKGSEASTVWSGSVKYCIKSLSEVQFASNDNYIMYDIILCHSDVIHHISVQ